MRRRRTVPDLKSPAQPPAGASHGRQRISSSHAAASGGRQLLAATGTYTHSCRFVRCRPSAGNGHYSRIDDFPFPGSWRWLLSVHSNRRAMPMNRQPGGIDGGSDATCALSWCALVADRLNAGRCEQHPASARRKTGHGPEGEPVSHPLQSNAGMTIDEKRRQKTLARKRKGPPGRRPPRPPREGLSSAPAADLPIHDLRSVVPG